MINPVFLQTFCELVAIGHFTRTAEKLHMTQSGVSQHVKKLETHFNQPLLLREGKRFTLTHAGETLYREAQATLFSLQHLDEVLASDSPYSGNIRLMSPGSVGLKLYPQLLTWQQQHSDLQIDYRFAPNKDISNAVMQQQADIGLTTEQLQPQELHYQAISSENLCLVTPAAVVKIDWNALLTLGFIGHPDGAHHATLLLSRNFSQFEHVAQLPVKGFSNQVGLILEPVARGLGFTVLPQHAVNAFAQQHLIRVHALPHPVTETLYLCQKRHYQPAKRITEVVAQLPGWL